MRIINILVEKYRKWKEYKEFYNERKKSIIAIIFLKIFFLMIQMVYPLIYTYYINFGLLKKNHNIIFTVVIIYISTYFVDSLCKVIYCRIVNKFSFMVNENVKKKLLLRLFSMQQSKVKGQTAGDLANTIYKDADYISNFFLEDVINYGIDILAIVISVGLLIKTNLILACICCCTIPFAIWVANTLGRKAHNVNAEYRKLYGEYENYCYNIFQNWKRIKMNDLYDNESEQFNQRLYQIGDLYLKKQMVSFWNKVFHLFKDEFLIKVNLYFIGGLLIYCQKFDIAGFVLFLKYFENLYKYTQSVMNSFVEYRSKCANLNKVDCILAFDESSDVRGEKPINHRITLNDLACSYEKKSIFCGLSLDVFEMEHVAVVGASGCGKSSLLKMLIKMKDVESGNIQYGYKNIEDVRDGFFVENVGVILQDTFFLNLTILENMKLVDENLTDEDVVAICKELEIDEMISNLSKGYDTLMGVDGCNLSGGQRQSLAIVRLLLSSKEMLFLDEVTSAMDTQNEQKILRNIREYFKNKTMLIISHRLSTIKDMDKIIVFEDKDTFGIGTHEILNEYNEYYHTLFSDQINCNS